MALPTTPTTAQLDAVNEMLMSVGQTPVTQLEATNPDVALAFETLTQVSRGVQAEGWTFNKEFMYDMTRLVDRTIDVPDNMLQVSLSKSDWFNKSYRGVVRTQTATDTQRKLYDIINHTFFWPQTMKCDVVWFHEWVAIPIPVQTYIVARAAKLYSQRTVGDGTQYSALQEQETACRAYALEYDTQQIDRFFFGYNVDGQFYNSYQPFQALSR